MKNLFPLLFLSILLISSCGDETSDPGPGTDEAGGRKFENCRVIKSEREKFSDHLYEYDDQGRLKEYSYSDYSGEYTYNGDQTILKTYYKGELSSTLTITTGTDRLPLQYVIEYTNGNKTQTVLYQYDDKNQLVKITKTTEGSTSENHTVFQWLNGNMIAESKPDGSNMTTYTYTETANQPVDWFGEIGIDYGLRAIRNKNRVKTITQPDGDVFTHSYKENSDGLITSRTITTPDITYTNYFTHECK